jgi:hypothetical protein
MLASLHAPLRGKPFGHFLLILPFALILAASTQPSLAEDAAATLTTLLDRAQIEDMLVDYYGQLGAGRHDFGAFYVEDAVLDVNGLVAQGRQGIEDLYKKIAERSPRRPGTFRMLLTNPKIVVNGDTATADVIWTGVNWLARDVSEDARVALGSLLKRLTITVRCTAKTCV